MGRLNGKDPQPGGQGDRFGAALGVELAHDGIHVELDRVLAHIETGGDPFVRQALGQ